VAPKNGGPCAKKTRPGARNSQDGGVTVPLAVARVVPSPASRTPAARRRRIDVCMSALLVRRLGSLSIVLHSTPATTERVDQRPCAYARLVAHGRRAGDGA
jgi:hypothetical protein